MLVLRVNLSLAGDLPRPVAGERQDVDHSRRPDARDRSRPLQHVIEEGVLLREVRNPKARIDPQDRRVLRFESQIDVEHANKTAHQQSRAHQQDGGEGDFGNHQSVAQPGTPLAGAQTRGRPPSAHPARASAGACSAGSTPNRTPVRTAASSVKASAFPSMRTLVSKGRLKAFRCATRTCAGHRETQPEHGAATGERDAFGKHLPEQAEAARAERRPHRQFLLPRSQAGQLQIREVRAYNQHHHADRAGQHEQGRPHSSIDALLERNQPRIDRVAFRDAGSPSVLPAA